MDNETMTAAHANIDAHLATLRSRIEEAMLDHAAEGYDVSFEAVVGQILMEVVCPSGVDLTMNGDHKVFLVRVAEHMGSDWAQSLFHAARFITKVA